MQANYDRTAEAMKMNAVSQIALIQARSDFEKAQADIKNYQAALMVKILPSLLTPPPAQNLRAN